MTHCPRLQRFRLLRRRRCICGSSWPCSDAYRISTLMPIPDGEAYRMAAASWDGQAFGFVLPPPLAASTAMYRQVGGAGTLTPAQLYRANRDSIR
jgi:hypothetical protein